MNYKLDFPISNYVAETERTLGAYIDLIDKYKEHVDTLYFPLGYIYEDVNLWGIRAPAFIYDFNHKLSKENVLRWENAIQQILSYVNLPVKVLVNNIYSPAFSNEEAMKMVGKKLEFYAKRYNIDSVVVADTQIIPFIKQMGLQVCLSTNSHNSLTELDMIMQLYGADTIKSFVLQRDNNRQPAKIKSYLNKRGLMDKVVLLANEGCINACPYKQSGDIEISLDQVQNKIYKIHNVGCSILDQNIPWTFLTSQFLSKKMIETYYPEVKMIKISGRDKDVSKLKYYFKHWVDGEDLPLPKILNVNGGIPINVGDLDNHPTYTKDVMSCNKECLICDKCSDVYSQFVAKSA